MKMLRLHPYLVVGGALVLFIAVLAIFAPILSTYEATAIRPRDRLQAPSRTHIMGTDEFGRDVFTRVLYGARSSLRIGFAVVILTVVSGISVGLLSGFYPGIDRVIMRVLDGWMAFPEIILAVTLAAIWGSGQSVLIFAISFAYFPRMARIVRSIVINVKQLGFIEAARATGAKDVHILLRHILPNCIPSIIVQATFSFAAAILAEAALSFLGVGIQAPMPSLGGMVSDARNYLPIAPWIGLYPGFFIVLSVLGLNLLGDGLRDLLDPQV